MITFIKIVLLTLFSITILATDIEIEYQLEKPEVFTTPLHVKYPSGFEKTFYPNRFFYTLTVTNNTEYEFQVYLMKFKSVGQGRVSVHNIVIPLGRVPIRTILPGESYTFKNFIVEKIKPINPPLIYNVDFSLYGELTTAKRVRVVKRVLKKNSFSTY